MKSPLKTGLTALLAISMLAVVPASFASNPEKSTLKKLWAEPMVKQAAIGAGAGAAAGVLTDKTSVGKGALTGAVVGVGTGALSQSKYLKDKPLLRKAAQGAVIGTGTSYAIGGSKLKGAAVGAGAGAGVHYIKKYVDTH